MEKGRRFAVPREKIKFALRISPQTQELVKERMPMDNCQTQNEFIEKAIRFYAGYLMGNAASDFLPQALVAALRGTVQDSENGIARLLFKLAVEVDMMMHLFATAMEIEPEILGKLRGLCVREIKKTNGSISLQELPSGEILSLFSDTELWEYPGQLVRKREMVIGGKVFHIASVFQGGEKNPSTPTGKLLSHIDRQLQKDPGGV